jgi:hypothetical protein
MTKFLSPSPITFINLREEPGFKKFHKTKSYLHQQKTFCLERYPLKISQFFKIMNILSRIWITTKELTQKELNRWKID